MFLIGNVSEISSICIDGPVINSLITGKHVAITPQIELDAIWLQFSLLGKDLCLVSQSGKTFTHCTRPFDDFDEEGFVKCLYCLMQDDMDSGLPQTKIVCNSLIVATICKPIHGHSKALPGTDCVLSV